MRMIHFLTLSSIALLLPIPGISKPTLLSNDTVVLVGDSTFLNCSGGPSLNWRFHPLGHKGHDSTDEEIYIWGKLEPKYEQKGFRIAENTTAEEVNLVIENVTTDMAGTYECFSGFEFESLQLIVLENEPFCQMTAVLDNFIRLNTCEIPEDDFIGQNTCKLPQDGFIGPNTCGISQHNISISCNVTYFGNDSPVLELKKMGESEVLESCSNKPEPENVGNRTTLTCNFTMEADLHLDGAQFICQTTHLTQRQYNCTTESLKILYSINGDPSIRATRQLDDEVDCTANCSQPCGYKWIWSETISQSERQSTEYFTRVLKVTRSGSYRCEAICQIGHHSCKVTPMFVDVSSPTASGYKSSGATDAAKIIVPIMAVILILLLVGSVIYSVLRRKSTRQNSSTATDTPSVQRLTDNTSAAEPGIEAHRCGKRKQRLQNKPRTRIL